MSHESPSDDPASPAARTFGTVELLETILLNLLADLHEISPQEDPRSVKTHRNAAIIMELLRMTEVNKSWYSTISNSAPLQRALFLQPDNSHKRTWHHHPIDTVRLRSYYRTSQSLAKRPPTLNPVVQVAFPGYQFRFWHLSIEVSGNKHVAYLIIPRAAVAKRATLSFNELAIGRGGTQSGGTDESGGGRSSAIDRMLLAQPPIHALEATIWDQRDYETNEHFDQTLALSEDDSRFEFPGSEGATVGAVHERARRLFRDFPDIGAIKLTTT